MKISLNWIQELVDLKGVTLDQITSQLTLAGLEVEDVHDQQATYKNFVIAKVLEKQKHPKADKLSLCKVDAGEGVLEVICGAPNVEAGQTVILAREGAVVPRNQMVITKAKIRGIESNGMICSDFELNFSDDHSGIKILPDSLKAGMPLAEAFGLNDVVLEIGITPNRPDALSHIGVARDLAAIFDRELTLPESITYGDGPNVNSLAAVEILDPDLCPRYAAKVIKGVKVSESPEWLKKRLTDLGLNPVNNVVDITNYVMLLLGQPLHAFDYDLLNGHKIVVRRAGAEQEFQTLDGKVRKLEPNDLLICDAKIPVALAGVMGGENSKVFETTENILLESAYFTPGGIRKTSKRMALSTDASYRFERGIDPELAPKAAEIAARMFSEICGGTVASGIIDDCPEKIAKLSAPIRYERIKRILGFDIAPAEVERILSKLGFVILSKSDEGLSVTIPSNRPDVEREIDLIEEVGRIYGFENIPDVEKIAMTFGAYRDTTIAEGEYRDHLINSGFYEIITNSFLSGKYAETFGKPVKLLNSQSQEMEFLRTSLIPGALDVVRRNIAVGEKDLRLFEVGNVFSLNNDAIESFEDFTETRKICLILTGKSARKEWYRKEESQNFFDLKGAVNSLLTKNLLDCELLDSYYQEGNNIFDYFYTVSGGKSVIASGGKLKKNYLKSFDIEQEVFAVELDLERIKQLPVKAIKYKELQKFPKVTRDAALLLNSSIKLHEIEDCIVKNKTANLRSFRLFDLYEGDQTGSGTKSLGYSFEYFATDRTLTDAEVEQEFNKLISLIKNKFKAKLRGE